MPINKTVKGDLVEMACCGYFDAIVHGCNCFTTMGAGIAPKINEAFEGIPLRMDKLFPYPKGDKRRLGLCSFATYYSESEYALTIVNAYIQYGFSKQAVSVDYKAVHDCFSFLNEHYTELSMHSGKPSVGIPMIGAGLAGGDWEKIKGIINEVTPNLDITLVIYNK